ncbi:MAG: hypothetical protein NTU41_06650 [Chloroflexi bacterium]|nr:hypothetical protein [Chloroflexota bacterium]
MPKLHRWKERVFEIFPVRKTLWRGFVITAPLLIIVWIVFGVLSAVNSLGDKLLNPFVSGDHLFWGTGVLLVLAFMLIIGRIEVYYEGRQRGIWQAAVGKIPFFGPFIAMSNTKAISFDSLRKLTPCKFWLSDTTPHYGFIVNQQKVRGTEAEIDVYRPNVPTIIPGDLMPLKKRLVIKLGNPSGEILQKLASGGLISSDEEIPVPWDDETEEEFRERINLTPLEIAVKRILAGQSGTP